MHHLSCLLNTISDHVQTSQTLETTSLGTTCTLPQLRTLTTPPTPLRGLPRPYTSARLLYGGRGEQEDLFRLILEGEKVAGSSIGEEGGGGPKTKLTKNTNFTGFNILSAQTKCEIWFLFSDVQILNLNLRIKIGF